MTETTGSVIPQKTIGLWGIKKEIDKSTSLGSLSSSVGETKY